MPVVEAVMAASGTLIPSHKGLSKVVEKAMTEAIIKAQAEGITHPGAVKLRMMQARAEITGKPLEGDFLAQLEAGVAASPQAKKKAWWKFWRK